MIFYQSFWDAVKDLPDADRLASYDAIMEYAFTGEEPQINGIAKIVFTMAKPQIDANEERRKNGAKGGRPKKNAENPNKPVVLQNKTEEKKEEKPPETVKKTEAKKRKEVIKHKYGTYQNVLLSDAELETLKKEFPNDWSDWIETLSSGIASKGYHYTNFLATIRNWAKREKKNNSNTSQSRFSNFAQSNTDWDEMAEMIMEKQGK